jgi:hypothetical protein
VAGLAELGVDHVQVVVEPDGAIVEPHVIVRAQAQHVAQHVRAVVRMAGFERLVASYQGSCTPTALTMVRLATGLGAGEAHPVFWNRPAVDV